MVIGGFIYWLWTLSARPSASTYNVRWRLTAGLSACGSILIAWGIMSQGWGVGGTARWMIGGAIAGVVYGVTTGSVLPWALKGRGGERSRF